MSGLKNYTKYYWRVAAKNNKGTSTFSSVWNFTTLIALPLTPALVSPANNAVDQLTNPTLSWDSSAGATSYGLQVSSDSNFTTLVFNDTTITTTSKQISGVSNSTMYYWRVNAKNAAGESGYASVLPHK